MIQIEVKIELCQINEFGQNKYDEIKKSVRVDDFYKNYKLNIQQIKVL